MDFFSQLVESIANSSLLTIAGFVLGILGIVVAILFHAKSKRERRPTYALRSFNIVTDLVSNLDFLDMRYAGKPIKTLTATKMIFYNAGRETIDSEDVPSSDPITLRCVDPFKILDAKVLWQKNPVNNFSIRMADDKASLQLDFEYIDRNEGVVIQVLHTGRSSKDVGIYGTIKGAGKPIRQPMPRSSFQFYSNISMRWVRYLSGALVLAIPAIFTIYLIPSLSTFEDTSTWTVNLLMLVATIIAYGRIGYVVLKSRLPKGFEIFEEDFEFSKAQA